MINTTDALARPLIAESFAGHRAGGSTDAANSAVEGALMALIASRAATPAEVVGKLDCAWLFYADFEPSIAGELCEIMNRMIKGASPLLVGWRPWSSRWNATVMARSGGGGRSGARDHALAGGDS